MHEALTDLRGSVLDPDQLVRAVGAGRQKGQQPRWKRVELRYVDLKAGRHLQITAYDETQAHTANHPVGRGGSGGRRAADGAFRQLARRHHDRVAPAAGHQEGAGAGPQQARVTSRSRSIATTTATSSGCSPRTTRCWSRSGSPTAQGRAKPSRQAKYRQVEEFLRILDTAITDAIEQGHLRRPTAAEPLRIVDLGCGNAYLTFAAHRFLGDIRGLPVHLVGVDVKQQSRDHNTEVAAGLGSDAEFVVGSIADARLDARPDVVLALHACDTATDEALARAVEWEAPLVLAAPCCHHDIAAQLRRAATPAPYRCSPATASSASGSPTP